MEHREKLFLGNIFLNFELRIFGSSHSRYVPLKAVIPLPSSGCKGEAFLPTYNAFNKVLMRGGGGGRFGFDYVMWGRFGFDYGGGGGGGGKP